MKVEDMGRLVKVCNCHDVPMVMAAMKDDPGKLADLERLMVPHAEQQITTIGPLFRAPWASSREG